ncbi:putative protein kinase RLK-Pelle-CrRLK1L-1 family [Helianthus debilis subsp. tardiflorus]
MLPAPIKHNNYCFVLPDQTCQRLTLAQIKLATNNFDEALVIGRGGFGKVYISLEKFDSVNDIAIKRLDSTSNQGATEFEAEVKLLSKLRHGNLVPLVGYCNEGNEMVLAYEFMPNGTLEDHLHKGDIDAARGLDYLHTGTSTQHGVIHRDVKTSNILLDSNFAARVSDFGLAKVGPINQTRTHLSTLVKGTFGYMDPCYFQSGKLTRKSDIYAFGVVLFEVLCGKQVVDPSLGDDEWSLANWAKHHYKEGRLNEIIEHRLIGQISKKCLKEFAGIAAHCLHDQPKQRPTMAEVVVKLESIMSRERERVRSGVDDGRFINKVRYIFTGKADLMQTRAKGSKSEIRARYTQKSTDRVTRTFTYGEFVRVRTKWNNHKFFTESGVGLVMYVRERDIGTSELDLKPEELNHPNLVKFLGYWLDEQVLSCVYEEIPGVSLDKLLFGEPGTASLSWVARLKIAVGAAQGLSFLHKKGHPAYSQFKTACILVDKDYNARLWDFEVDNSFVALGSYAFQMDAPYAAPEWFRYQADVKFEGIIIAHQCEDGFGVKSEIYSFGVVLLEILTGMKVYDYDRPVGKQNLVKWATPLLAHEVNLEMILDPQLQDNNHPPKGAFMLAELVSKCLQPTQDERPSMKNILHVLNKCYIEQFDS